MKREWDKACKKLAKAAGDRVSCLLMEQWPTGMEGSDYLKPRYAAYIEDIGYSTRYNNPTEAVTDIIQQLSNKC